MIMLKIKRKCAVCLNEKEIEIDSEVYQRWQQGEHIQEVMSEVSEDDRELLISGVCGTCFDKLFRPEDD